MYQASETGITLETKAEEPAGEDHVAAAGVSGLPSKNHMQQGRSSSSSSDEDMLIPAARPERLSSAGAAMGHTNHFDNSLRQLQQQSQKASLDELHAVEQSHTCNLTPARDLGDVSHRLMVLEKAVKAHFMPAPRSDSSILSAFSPSNAPQQCGTASISGAFGSPMAAKTSERGRLRDAVSELKAEVASLAARDVEGRLLQQRVAQLEVLVNGISGAYGNGLGSLTGGVVSGAGNVVVVPAGPHCRTPPRVTQAPSEVSALVDCFSDMQDWVKQLAQAQDKCEHQGRLHVRW
eukprot:gene9144-9312_t